MCYISYICLKLYSRKIWHCRCAARTWQSSRCNSPSRVFALYSCTCAATSRNAFHRYSGYSTDSQRRRKSSTFVWWSIMYWRSAWRQPDWLVLVVSVTSHVICVGDREPTAMYVFRIWNAVRRRARFGGNLSQRSIIYTKSDTRDVYAWYWLCIGQKPDNISYGLFFFNRWVQLIGSLYENNKYPKYLIIVYVDSNIVIGSQNAVNK